MIKHEKENRMITYFSEDTKIKVHMPLTHIFINKNVLVTGAYGFVGNHLMDNLPNAGANLFALMHDEDYRRQGYAFCDWHSRVKTIQADIRNYEQLKRAISIAQPEYIFHLAAISQVTEANLVPRQTWETIVMGTVNLLEAARKLCPNAKIVIASSDKAYGGWFVDITGLTEKLPPQPGHPYDTSKAAADLAAQSYAKHYNLNIAIARMANIFGPGDLNFKRLIPETINDIIHDRVPHIRSNGKYVREYMNINDAVSAYFLLANSLNGETARGNAEIYNFGGISWSVEDLVTLILVLMKREDLKMKILNQANDESSRISINDEKAADKLGWKRPDDMEQFAKQLFTTITWYQEYFQASRSQ